MVVTELFVWLPFRSGNISYRICVTFRNLYETDIEIHCCGCDVLLHLIETLS